MSTQLDDTGGIDALFASTTLFRVSRIRLAAGFCKGNAILVVH